MQLKQILKKIGLSARQAGELVGVTEQTIRNWASGRTHPAARQEDLANALLLKDQGQLYQGITDEEALKIRVKLLERQKSK